MLEHDPLNNLHFEILIYAKVCKFSKGIGSKHISKIYLFLQK